MEQDLIKLIDDFSLKLSKAQQNQYAVKLKKFFIPYIMEKYIDINNIERIFKDEFSYSDIINATVYYMENNQNVKSKASINTYLTSMNRFFELILIKKYPNANIINHFPFSSKFDDVVKKLINDGYEYKDAESFPAINDMQFDYIIKYLKNYNKGTLKTRQVKIIIKLYLLYGINILEKLLRTDVDTEKNLLSLTCSNNHKVILEIPYQLSQEIKNYLLLRKDENPLLFITEDGNPIKSAFLADILTDIKTSYEVNMSADDNPDGRNPFTPTGLQKYAIIRMILEGMNQSIIIEFTGQQQAIYDDCQEYVNLEKELNRNRYINHMLRGIETYDLI